MPKISVKTNIITSLIENAANEIIFMYDMELDDDDMDDEVDEVLEDLEDNLFISLSCRRGVETNDIPKSVEWRENILTNMDDNRFLQMLRVSRSQFYLILGIIKTDYEFQKPHSCKQFSVELQLAIVLYRLGSYGENAAVRKIATLFAIGDGGTLDIITKRVFRSILKLSQKYIYWPCPKERSQIVAETFHEMPFCIGYVDGTEIKLAEAPVVHHESFYSKSRIYSVKAQVICDHNLKIRHAVIGSQGSFHDAKIFKQCDILKNKEQFFSNHEWIAGDSAYPLSETVITPYRSNANHMDENKRKAFNLRHSKYRVRIEHFFGQLKEKFASLKELRMRLEDKKSHKFCCEWILVCCILHNIILQKNNNVSSDNIENLTSEDEEDEDEPERINSNCEIKRQAIYRLMFES